MTFATACFAGYFWATYAVPETASVSLEEMDAVFGSSAGREDMLLKYQVRFCNVPAIRLLTVACLQIEESLGLHELVSELTAGPGSTRHID